MIYTITRYFRILRKFVLDAVLINVAMRLNRLSRQCSELGRLLLAEICFISLEQIDPGSGQSNTHPKGSSTSNIWLSDYRICWWDDKHLSNRLPAL